MKNIAFSQDVRNPKMTSVCEADIMCMCGTGHNFLHTATDLPILVSNVYSTVHPRLAKHRIQAEDVEKGF